MNDFWKNVWDSKGLSDNDDLLFLNGYEHLKVDISSKFIADDIADLLNLEVGDSILEVGCGAGFLSREFVTKYNYYGVDYSKPLIEKHKRLFTNHNVSHAEANAIPFKNRQFDHCFCFGVFQYLPNLEYAKCMISEMKRIVSKNILLGDLKEKPTRPNHLPCPKNMIEKLGFTILNIRHLNDSNRYHGVLHTEDTQ
tara:strand:+ start:6104 stop:6691 length:588 start_codon:yes stop_codon:yes gene_type:complete